MEPPPIQPFSGTQEPTPPSPRRRRSLIAIVLATLLVVGASGAATAYLLFRGASEDILELVPASSDVVLTAYFDPSAGQKVNLMRLKDRFPALRDDRFIRDEVDRTLDEALAGLGLTHEDVLPWLGSQVALAVDVDMEAPNQEMTTTVFIVSADDGAAATALETALRPLGEGETREHSGVTMHTFGSDPATTYALIGDVVVLSDHTSGVARAIDAADGTTPVIADDPVFRNTVASLPEARLALGYVNIAQILNGILATSEPALTTEAVPQLGVLRAMRGMGMTMSARPDGMALDFAVRLDESELDEASRVQLEVSTHDNAMLSFVPSDSFVVATDQALDVSLRQTVDQVLATPEGERIRQRFAVDEALATLTGDVAFELRPGTGEMPVAGAILLGVNDEAAAQRTLDGLADLFLANALAPGSRRPSKSDLSRRELRALGLSPPSRRGWKTSMYQGTRIRYLEDPSLSAVFLPAYAVVDGAAIIASSPSEVRTVIDTAGGAGANITTSSSYTQAIARVPNGTSSFYVDASAIIGMLAPVLRPDLSSNLEPVKTIVAGSRSSPTLITERLFVEIS